MPVIRRILVRCAIRSSQSGLSISSAARTKSDLTVTRLIAPKQKRPFTFGLSSQLRLTQPVLVQSPTVLNCIRCCDWTPPGTSEAHRPATLAQSRLRDRNFGSTNRSQRKQFDGFLCLETALNGYLIWLPKCEQSLEAMHYLTKFVTDCSSNSRDHKRVNNRNSHPT